MLLCANRVCFLVHTRSSSHFFHDFTLNAAYLRLKPPVAHITTLKKYSSGHRFKRSKALRIFLWPQSSALNTLFSMKFILFVLINKSSNGIILSCILHKTDQLAHCVQQDVPNKFILPILAN